MFVIGRHVIDLRSDQTSDPKPDGCLMYLNAPQGGEIRMVIQGGRAKTSLLAETFTFWTFMVTTVSRLKKVTWKLSSTYIETFVTF